MKRIFLFPLALALATTFLHAQSDALFGFIQEHKNDKSFTYAFLSKDLVEVVAQNDIKDEDWKKMQQVVKNIGSLSILAADSIQDGLSLYREARALVQAGEFEELLAVRDGHDNVRIWVKSESNVVTDLVLLVGSPDEFVLVCFAGALELGNIHDLAALFEAGEAEQMVQRTQALSIDFSISPNPGNGLFTLAYSDEQDPPAMLTVIDQNGRQVSALSLSGDSREEVSLRELPSGLYWFQLKTAAGKVGVRQVQNVRQ